MYDFSQYRNHAHNPLLGALPRFVPRSAHSRRRLAQDDDISDLPITASTSDITALTQLETLQPAAQIPLIDSSLPSVLTPPTTTAYVPTSGGALYNPTTGTYALTSGQPVPAAQAITYTSPVGQPAASALSTLFSGSTGTLLLVGGGALLLLSMLGGGKKRR